jgi:hypothetical protein
VTGSRALWLTLALAAGFTWGALRLLGVEFRTGDFYPEYSSLRTDPLGAKLLYDALARLPGLSVARGYTPLDFFQEHSATILLLGTRAAALDEADFLEQLETAARRGNRVVSTLASAAPPEKSRGTLERTWGVRLRYAGHRYDFDRAEGWKKLNFGNRPAAIERAFGKGSIVLFASSEPFANQSTVTGEDLGSVSAAIGPNTHVWFDETHLGIAESGSVMGLARRYRLTGFVLGLALCAALALWKYSSPFPPPQALREKELAQGRTSFAGLASLLSRHLSPSELAGMCWREWLKSNRRQIPPERAEQAAAIVREQAARPLEAMREIQAVIRAKGAI